MPTILNYPNDTGFDFAWASVEIAIGGLRMVVGTRSIKYSEPLTMGKAYGTAGEKIIRTRGTIDPTGTWELYRSSWDAIMEQLTLQGSIGFAERTLPITVSMAEPSNPLLTTADILEGVRIHSPDAGGSEGTDPLIVTVQMDIMRIRWGKKQGSPGYRQLSPSNVGVFVPAAVI